MRSYLPQTGEEAETGEAQSSLLLPSSSQERRDRPESIERGGLLKLWSHRIERIGWYSPLPREVLSLSFSFIPFVFLFFPPSFLFFDLSEPSPLSLSVQAQSRHFSQRGTSSSPLLSSEGGRSRSCHTGRRPSSHRGPSPPVDREGC